MASGLYYATFNKMLKNTAALDVTDAGNKFALYTTSLTTQAFDTDTAYNASPYTSNEVPNGNGYTTGGLAVSSPATSNPSAGVFKFTAANASWASSTFTNVRYALYYAAGVANEVYFLVDFGSGYSTSNGTFQIQWNASGIFTVQLS